MQETTWDGKPVAQKPPHGAAVVVYRQAGDQYEYLILHRAHNGPDYEGEWAWGPPAGARLPGEEVDHCARRELIEESGLELPCTRIHDGNDDWFTYYAAAPANAEVKLSKEHDRFEWLRAREAARRCSPRSVSDQILAVARSLGDPGLEP